MDEKIIEIGYHATSNENAKSIIEIGFKKSISTPQKKHWLGDGVYFFTDIYWAVEWNINQLKREENYTKNIEDYTVLSSKIFYNEDDLLDLSSKEGKELLKYLMERLEDLLYSHGKISTVNKLDKKSKKFIVNLLEDYGFFENFGIIKATYIKQSEMKNVRYDDDFIMNIQCQICVKDNECIKEINEYPNREKLKDIYNNLKEG